MLRVVAFSPFGIPFSSSGRRRTLAKLSKSSKLGRGGAAAT
jgi:hypothetical protein